MPTTTEYGIRYPSLLDPIDDGVGDMDAFKDIADDLESALLNTSARWLFGDGADGDVTIVGTVALTRNMHYRNLTVPDGTRVNTGGWRVYVQKTLAFTGAGAGRIACDGGAGGDGALGAAGAAGAAAGGTGSSAGVYGGFGAGGGAGGIGIRRAAAGAGSNAGTAGVAATGATAIFGGNGGNGGAGGAGAGGAGATSTIGARNSATPAVNADLLRGIAGILGYTATLLASPTLIGFVGGHGAGSGGIQTGADVDIDGSSGGGGGGGGVVWVAAYKVTGTGIISADGGAAGAPFKKDAGTAGAPDYAIGGSGGGGGGLAVLIATSQAPTVTVRATGGTGTAGLGTLAAVTAGGNGVAGSAVKLVAP